MYVFVFGPSITWVSVIYTVTIGEFEFFTHTNAYKFIHTYIGNLFHIDFGKMLGDAQKIGNIIRRDRVPFVLTGDMA